MSTEIHPSLANRQTSGFPLSIGTSLSLETLFTPIQEVYDPSRNVDNLTDLSQYTRYVFNVSTLLRNILATLNFKDLTQVRHGDVYTVLLEEIEFLTHFFQSNLVPINFYVNSYHFVKSHYTEKQLRIPTTDKQHLLNDITTYCLSKISKEDDVDHFVKDIHYEKTDSVLLFTHIPFDLLSYSNFIRLDLLESNTGVIKPRQKWNTKYHDLPGRDLSNMPFMEYLLAEVFGDKVMFVPAPLKKRLEVFDSLTKKGVHPLLSEFAMLTLMK